jgi:hypothetical protein
MMRRLTVGLLLALSFTAVRAARATDIVQDWNRTIRDTIQHDGTNVVNLANPGWSTRSIAMLNTTIYDVFQAFNRTHQPWLVDVHAGPNTSMNAAINQAAFEVLSHCYTGESTILTNDYNARMALIPNGLDKTNGIALGHQIANACVVARNTDVATNSVPYTPGNLPGQWRPDPYHPTQQAWGPEWGAVATFGIPNTTSFINAIPAPPALNSQEYTDGYNQVKSFGDLNSATRTAHEKETALFWAYDHGGIGPPSVLFLKNLEEIGNQVGNTPEQNARMYAMMSVAEADAAIAAWDAKFTDNFWRPVTAIQEGGAGGAGDADGNANTIGNPTWQPLGAPGTDPNSTSDDFTPPFPSWTSGHATMGGAVFKSLERFYGTNNFGAIPGASGSTFTLTSDELNPLGVPGMTRSYSSFTQDPSTWGLGMEGQENTPESENGMSRIYLGIHWIWDQKDGTAMGENIANYIADNFFQAVPEPASAGLLWAAILGGVALRRRLRKEQPRSAV